MALVLRPRQVKAIDDLRAAFKSGRRAPILVAPTGFGKSATAITMIQTSVQKGLRVWFMAHLKEILNDTTIRLTAAGVKHGYIWAGHLADRRQQVQVVSVQTAARRLDRIDRPDLIIVDEAHLAVAQTYQDVFEWAKAGPKYWERGGALLLHLTATPKRLDGRGMGEVADAIIPTCSSLELIQEGLLAHVRYLRPDTPDTSGMAHRGGDFATEQASALMSKPAIVGSALRHYQEHGAGRPGLGFCVDIKSARVYAERFAEAGLRTVAISGEDDDDERYRALSDIQSGKLDFVFNCKLWVAGVDAPALSYIADLAPTESLTRYLQGLGRGLRTSPGKTDLVYADHAGNYGRHGNPLAAREWDLAADPAKAKKGGKSAVPEKKCPVCFASVAGASLTCICGHVFQAKGREIEEQEGVLTEVELMEQKRIEAAKQQRMAQGRAQSLEELEAEGRRRGIKHPAMWARHVLRGRLAKQQREAR